MTDGWASGQMERQMDGCTDGWRDGWTGEQTNDKVMNKQTSIQTAARNDHEQCVLRMAINKANLTDTSCGTTSWCFLFTDKKINKNR